MIVPLGRDRAARAARPVRHRLDPRDRRSASGSRDGSTRSSRPRCALRRLGRPPRLRRRPVRLGDDAERRSSRTSRVSLADGGFEHVIFVNGHYTNSIALSRRALGDRHDDLPSDAIVFGFNYWDALPPEQGEAYLGSEVGLHANIGETSAVMAVDESLVDLDAAVAEYPDFPGWRSTPLVSAFFLSGRRTYRATRSGVWGDPSASTAELGRRTSSRSRRPAFGSCRASSRRSSRTRNGPEGWPDTNSPLSTGFRASRSMPTRPGSWASPAASSGRSTRRQRFAPSSSRPLRGSDALQGGSIRVGRVLQDGFQPGGSG